jgi:hypothetical protein
MRVTASSVYSFAEPGIVEQCLLPGAKQTVAAARENVAMFLELAGSRGAACLVDLREGGAAEPGVNDVYADETLMRRVHGLAIVTGSLVSQMVGNLYFALQRPRVPMRLFTDRGDALSWLRQHRR